VSTCKNLWSSGDLGMLPVEKSCVSTCKNLWSSRDLGMLPVQKSCVASCKNLWSSGDLGMLGRPRYRRDCCVCYLMSVFCSASIIITNSDAAAIYKFLSVAAFLDLFR
jgi:hypothetical protein